MYDMNLSALVKEKSWSGHLAVRLLVKLHILTMQRKFVLEKLFTS